ncbi:TrkA family potassium uptake protein [Parasphingopyxis algicola]|uniref:potassium channel family protein n=1 Tax=Parasphingopyxis algicola TaxID=2026624 RepID=UPI0015A060C5|nr:TrkA family potassium uptake protein [Parasphingopyxis algicola]QLC25911.1 TrkA family potassium uptake protein [Parasphingopyxis algicola]
MANIAVIGLGGFGSTLAMELARLGDHVLGIDITERQVTPCLGRLAEAIIADGRDIEALKEAGLASYEIAVIAIGEDLEANILCLMNLREIGVETIWVKALDGPHERILAALGAEHIIEPEREVGVRIAQTLHNPLMRDHIALANGQYLADIAVPATLAGKTLTWLDLEERFGIRCLGITRGKEFVTGHGTEAPLEYNDHLLLQGERKQLRKFSEEL